MKILFDLLIKLHGTYNTYQILHDVHSFISSFIYNNYFIKVWVVVNLGNIFLWNTGYKVG